MNILLGGFIVAQNDIEPFMIWSYYISPVMYGQNALVINEFLDKRWSAPNPDPRIHAPTVGKVLLKSRCFFTDDYMFWVCVGALLGFSLLFNILFIAALTFLNPLSDSKSIVLDEDVGKKNKKSSGRMTSEDVQEMLTVVPRVCKSWGNVVIGPYCWQEIDIEEWSNRSDPDNIDRMLRMLLVRSSGSLRKLCVSELQTDLIFFFVAEHAGSLKTLRLPRSNMSDAIVEQCAARLSTITFLDLSYCGKIGARSLEAVGKHCKLLTGLRRNMHPINIEGKVSQEDEAYAIAVAMPKIKQLEIAYLLIDTESVLKIILCGLVDREQLV